jgi:tRNA pseudouridine38-40 synthase
MVGSLKLVGEGKRPPVEMHRLLDARDRTQCGPVAPAAGLYLVRVDYGAPRGTDTEIAEDDD